MQNSSTHYKWMLIAQNIMLCNYIQHSRVFFSYTSLLPSINASQKMFCFSFCTHALWCVSKMCEKRRSLHVLMQLRMNSAWRDPFFILWHTRRRVVSMLKCTFMLHLISSFILPMSVLFWSTQKTHEKVFKTWLLFPPSVEHIRTGGPFIRLPFCVLQSKIERKQDQDINAKLQRGPVLWRMSAPFVCVAFERKAMQRCKLCCSLKWIRGTMWKLDSTSLAQIQNDFFGSFFLLLINSSAFHGFPFSFLLLLFPLWLHFLWLPFFLRHCVHAFPYIIAFCCWFFCGWKKSNEKPGCANSFDVLIVLASESKGKAAVCCVSPEIAWNSLRRNFPTHFFLCLLMLLK